MDRPGRILIVDDDRSLREFLKLLLEEERFEVQTAANAEEARGILSEAGGFDLLLTDVRLPGRDGIDLLEWSRERHPEMLTVVMTAYSTWQKAVEAMRLGAYDYIRKPFDNDLIRSIVSRAVELSERSRPPGEAPFGAELVGHSPAMQSIREQIRKIARTEATVLIRGESGTGKELIARSIHERSVRREGPFISVNCGAFPDTLLESELFGHVKGAFTGAVAEKPGLLEASDTGVFFLDEVGEMSAMLQVKLLRTLEERTFLPVGSTRQKRTDVRFIAATHRDLEADVEKKTFREDLFYRLNVIPLQVPPLRERQADIPLLVGRFLSLYRDRIPTPAKRFSDGGIDALTRYWWPGNIRELENCVQRAMAMASGEEIGVEDLDPRVLQGRGELASGGGEIPPLEEGFDLESVMSETEKQYIEQALEKSGGNLTRAAELLGITFRSLRYKIQKYGIQT